MILQERELTIRSAVPDDAEILTAWWNDGAVMAHAGFPYGLGTTAERVRAQIRRNEPGVSELLIVLCGGVPIGEMNYRSESKASAEIGIKLCVSSMQNQGLGKRLLALLLERLFELGFMLIRLDTNPNNLRAMHVYETLGFRRLGIRVDSWTDQLGRLQSAVDYELRPEDLKPWLNR
ncbi:MAG: GNAT family N-acetyltransferase, partial [Oscillospiraceae bacterium]|nr:GNAT family N-acetyltransferase [Oscillospiraceae bacterium]